MNKQEAIEKLYKEYNDFLSSPQPDGPFLEGYISASITAKSIINQIDEPQKRKVPQVAVEFYERYKDNSLLLGEWFSDFYSSEAIEEFPRMEELSEWLYDNDNEINKQRELALATLVTLGIDAVEVEKEKLYIVEIPNPNYSDSECKTVLKRTDENCIELCVFLRPDFEEEKYQLTESEIKQDFDWAWQFAEPVEED